jgi:23S rRNA (adenine2503-C2)-methyltransferase
MAGLGRLRGACIDRGHTAAETFRMSAPAASRPLLYDLTLPEMTELLVSWGEPAFRARQVYRQLYVNLAGDFDAMTDLPAALRAKLRLETTLSSLRPVGMATGDDGLTRKALFALGDDAPVETVLMAYEDRATVCVSSQSGCPMACVFCATGKLGFLHDLTSGQMVEQVMWAARELKRIGEPAPRHGSEQANRRTGEPLPERLTNVVFMGMGEPFNNYDAWWAAVERLHDPAGFNMGARSFTVSTVGLVPGIKRLAQEELPINLAISLHAADDALRTGMMPVNKSFPIEKLMAAVREYTEASGRRVSFEYVLLQEKNDRPDQAEQLGRLLRGASGIRPELCHVNLIPWNPVPGSPLGRSHRERVLAFQAVLHRHGVPCTVRVERGVDIGAACGQLGGLLQKVR